MNTPIWVIWCACGQQQLRFLLGDLRECACGRIWYAEPSGPVEIERRFLVRASIELPEPRPHFVAEASR